MRRLLLITLLLALASACGEEPPPPVAPVGGEAPQRFVADLRPLNRTDVDGTVNMSLDDNQLTVDLDVRGVEPMIHAQHIHGRRGDREASCPGRRADANDDDFVGREEGGDTYGEALKALEPFPTANRSRRLEWDLTIPVDPGKLEPLDTRVFVLQGRSADLDRRGRREYVPDMPIACGRIEPLGGMAAEGGQG